MVLVVKNLPANARGIRDMGSIPGWGRSPGEAHGNPSQYSCLENPMNRGAWWTTVYIVWNSHTWLKGLSMQAQIKFSILFFSDIGHIHMFKGHVLVVAILGNSGVSGRKAEDTETCWKGRYMWWTRYWEFSIECPNFLSKVQSTSLG